VAAWLTRAKDLAFRVGTGAHEAVLRASGGRVLGRVGRMPVLVLATTGRRTGARRTTVLTAPVVDGDRIVLVASFGGDDRHPAWYLNLREHPEVEITMQGSTRRMRARVADDDERAELWPRIVAGYRGYAGYQRRTSRRIPVVVLEPLEAPPGP
jgi:deazaflavin-dependent oxidoreductase (nitroreductase family)